MDRGTGGQGDVEAGVQGLNRLLQRIHALRDVGATYDEIAASMAVSKGTVWRLAHGKEPASPETRRKLGLPDKLPANVQFQTVRRCADCGAPFVSNSGKRLHCFRCVPYRDRSTQGG